MITTEYTRRGLPRRQWSSLGGELIAETTYNALCIGESPNQHALSQTMRLSVRYKCSDSTAVKTGMGG
jgi:hypothetical protein